MFRTVAEVRQSYGIVNESFTLSKLCFNSKKGSQILRTGSSGKESACQCRRCKRCGFDPWIGKIPWRKKWHPTPVFLPGELHGQRNLMGYSHGVAKSWTWLNIRAFIHSFNPHIKKSHLWSSTSRLERHLAYICPFPSYIPPEHVQNSSISQHDAKNLPHFSDTVSQTLLGEKERFSIHFKIINKGLSFHHSWSLESLTQEWKKLRIYTFILNNLIMDWRNQWDSKRTKRYQMLLNYFTPT